MMTRPNAICLLSIITRRLFIEYSLRSDDEQKAVFKIRTYRCVNCRSKYCWVGYLTRGGSNGDEKLTTSAEVILDNLPLFHMLADNSKTRQKKTAS